MWIESFLKYLELERNYSPRTIRSYGDSLMTFEKFFKKNTETVKWDTVDSDIIRNWVMGMTDSGAQPTTVNRNLSALRSFFSYLMRIGAVEVNPATKVKGPKKAKPLPYFLKESETDRLMDSALYPADFIGLRDRTILTLFYETGIRLSELEGLNYTDVDLISSQLKVTGKRNKQRIVPFGPELKSLLEQYQAARESHCEPTECALFINGKGKRLNKGSIAQLTHKYLSMVTTIKKRSPHVLRHTFATQILNHDGNLETVKELLGHESVATTEIYTHTTFEELKKIYKQAHPRS
ncbi:MAG: tyrosine recombinase XerC [Bacteroidaceae bacterium]|nr:tyrosine recombinase XerC [Bacteroidaceae bacterium]